MPADETRTEVMPPADATARVDFSSVPTVASQPVEQGAGSEIDLDLATRTRHESRPAPAPDETPSGNHVALPLGHPLQEYSIEAVLGAGGFGITYRARDNNLQCQVAIKEYLPSDLAVRAAGQTVMPRTESDTHGYHVGLDRFLAEARVLASFRHPNIVRVARFFEANRTAYMVMDYEEGHSLRDWLQAHGPADEATLLHMFLPLLDGLEVVHKAGVVHRDIKPANIYVRDADGSVVLLDFGAARQASGASSRSLTSIVTPGYAPFEQYHTRGAQGPWTDLYALGGVLYWLVTGQKPLEAPARIKRDSLAPALEAGAGRYSESFLRAIDWALTLDEEERPRSVAEFRAVLTGAAPAPERKATAAPANVAQQPPSAPGKPGSLKLALAGGAVALAALVAYLALPGGKPAEPAAPLAAAPEPVTAKEKKTGAGAKSAKSSGMAAGGAAPPAGSQPGAAGSPALLTFEIVPNGEYGEIFVDGQKIGTAPPLREYRLAAGKHKIEVRGNKPPNIYYYWVKLAPNEKKNIWAKFADEF